MPGGKPVIAVPGLTPTSPLMSVGPVLVTVEEPRTANVCAAPSAGCANAEVTGYPCHGDTGGIVHTHPSFDPLVEKFRAFGWDSVEFPGHDTGAIAAAVMGRSGTRPFMGIARTTKGKGISYMENVPIWHYRSPNKAEYEQGVRELEDLAR